MKFWAGVFFTLLVVSPKTEIVTEYETIVHRVKIEPEWENTPVLDSMIDWEYYEEQSQCLWYYMQEHEIEISLWNVLVAGDYTDMMGGACSLIGENNEH